MTKQCDSDSIYNYGLHFRRGVIVDVTSRCPLTCAHCTVSSSPQRVEEFPLDRLLTLIDELGADPAVELIVFSGGEPFLKLQRLQTLLGAVNDNGLKVDIVTSSHWATSYQRAYEILQGLPSITHLSFSADQYHLPFVPLERVKYAVEAALALDIGVGAFIVLENQHDDFMTTFRQVLGDALVERMDLMIEYVHLAGRANQTQSIVNNVERVTFDELPELTCQMPATPVVRQDGRVMTCCGDTVSDPDNWPALTYGNCNKEPLRTILDRADKNSLTHALRLLGPKKLAQIASQRAGKPLFTRLFERHNICDICRAVTTDAEVLAYVNDYLAESEVADSIATMRLLEYGEVSADIACAASEHSYHE